MFRERTAAVVNRIAARPIIQRKCPILFHAETTNTRARAKDNEKNHGLSSINKDGEF